MNITEAEIFFNIRLNHELSDAAKVEYGWGCLTLTKSRDLKQLISKPEYCAAFDKLLDIPGLWPILKLGALHRFLTVKCDDVIYRFMDVFLLMKKEIVHYLMWIHRVWVELLDRNTTLMNAVDHQTAEAVELKSKCG